jgi:hypothetical protein
VQRCLTCCGFGGNRSTLRLRCQNQTSQCNQHQLHRPMPVTLGPQHDQGLQLTTLSSLPHKLILHRALHFAGTSVSTTKEISAHGFKQMLVIMVRLWDGGGSLKNARPIRARGRMLHPPRAAPRNWQSVRSQPLPQDKVGWVQSSTKAVTRTK